MRAWTGLKPEFTDTIENSKRQETICRSSGLPSIRRWHRKKKNMITVNIFTIAVRSLTFALVTCVFAFGWFSLEIVILCIIYFPQFI